MIAFFTSWISRKKKTGTIEKLAGYVTRMAEEPIKKFMINEENQQFLLYDKEFKQAVEISLKDRVGAGYFGSVYVVENLVGAPWHLQETTELNQDQNTKLVAKFPHALRTFSLNFPLLLAELESRTELRNYRMVLARRRKYKKDPSYPP